MNTKELPRTISTSKQPNAFLSELLQTKLPSEQKQPAEKSQEYHKLELEQVIKKMDATSALRVQIGTFFGTANLTALGLAFSTKKVMIIIIAMSILLFFVVMDIFIRKTFTVFYYRALQLQAKLSPDEETILQIMPGDLPNEARRIFRMKNRRDRHVALNRTRIPIRSAFFRIPLGVITLELCAAVFLLVVLKWRLF